MVHRRTVVGTRIDSRAGSVGNGRANASRTEARRARASLVLGTVAVALAIPSTATAAPQPGAYGENDFVGFRNVLPPGQGQTVDAVQIVSFVGLGQRPPHDQDQLDRYTELIGATPGLNQATLRQHYKDANFGVRSSDVERTYSPRGDVTVVRDQYGGRTSTAPGGPGRCSVPAT